MEKVGFVNITPFPLIKTVFFEQTTFGKNGERSEYKEYSKGWIAGYAHAIMLWLRRYDGRIIQTYSRHTENTYIHLCYKKGELEATEGGFPDVLEVDYRTEFREYMRANRR